MTVQGINKNLITFQIQDRLLFLFQSMKNAVIRVVNEDNEQLNREIDSFVDDMFTIIADGTIPDILEQLFNAYDLVGQNPLTRYLLARELFDFGESQAIPVGNPTLNGVLDTIDISVQLYVMSLAFDNSVEIHFENETELGDVITALDTEFNRVVSNELIDSDVRISLIEMNVAAKGIFSNLDLAEIATVNTVKMSSTVLSYQYYGTSSNSGQIVALNKESNTGFIEGDIQIISTT